ncbi:4544_t:CDS:2, partial [Racocetra persica]
ITNNIQFENQNQIELLTLHIYDDAISEHKEERSMKNIKIIEYYKKRITKQAKAFKKGLEKIEDKKDILNNKESNENDNNNLNEEKNNNKTEEDNKLQIAINTID